MSAEEIVVRAVRTQQGDSIDVFAFFLAGADVLRVADITRLERDNGELRGFQRKEIQSHVRGIADYLDGGHPVLFPNAIILALSDEVKFTASRGPAPQDSSEIAVSGTLRLPIRAEGQRIAWVVDGQQRSLALNRARNRGLAVPIVAFVSSDLELQRSQFILVNKARPLPQRLITELLPEVSTLLPRDLAADRVPSELCNLLNSNHQSPFHRLIRRASSRRGEGGVISDMAIIATIRQSMKGPMGALHQYRDRDDACDGDAMFHTLTLFWSCVREAFPEAWGKSPEESRLMHSAGIKAMGALMDPIMLRADSSAHPRKVVEDALHRLAPHCAWTEGAWSGLGWKWNDVQSTPQFISRLSDHLIRLDRDLARPSK